MISVGGKAAQGAVYIDIAADSRDGCDAAQGVKNGWVADVASMQNVADSAQSRNGFRAKQTVGV